MNSFVFEFCIVVPFRRSCTCNLCGSGISSAVTRYRPGRCEGVERLADDPLLLLAAELPVAGTHIVPAGVPADVVECRTIVRDMPCPSCQSR